MPVPSPWAHRDVIVPSRGIIVTSSCRGGARGLPVPSPWAYRDAVVTSSRDVITQVLADCPYRPAAHRVGHLAAVPHDVTMAPHVVTKMPRDVTTTHHTGHRALGRD